ncbi:MAG: TlpA disulfide reductase family protein [Planctomycetota bacterium]|nr:TlpA disulfide reductase family protein [Planctomycetota bacterium]
MDRGSWVLSGVLVIATVLWWQSPFLVLSEQGVGELAPNWKSVTLDGEEIGSLALSGKVILMELWATWCPPCRKEVPAFIELQKTYGDRGLVVVGASVDRGGVEVVKKFVKEEGINYPVIMADPSLVAEFGKIIGPIRSIPTTIVIGPDGRIQSSHVGYSPKETLEKAVSQYFTE